jgi:hypothetical protein
MWGTRGGEDAELKPGGYNDSGGGARCGVRNNAQTESLCY